MKPYTLKHNPTGLYFRPGGGMGPTLSVKGKTYNSSINGLSYIHKKDPNGEFKIFAYKGGPTHLSTQSLNWESYEKSFVVTKVKVSDFTREEVVSVDPSEILNHALLLLKEASLELSSVSEGLSLRINTFLKEIEN